MFLSFYLIVLYISVKDHAVYKAVNIGSEAGVQLVETITSISLTRLIISH